MISGISWPAGYGLRELDEIDSTNEEARRMADTGERGPLWIVAARQTAGRGRRGRHWQSPAGNLAATLLLRPSRPANECAQLSFVAALSAADMLAVFSPPTAFRVKWPNDVLAGEHKIAGILLESAGSARSPLDWLAVGIGVNVAHYPPDAEFATTSLAQLGGVVPPLSEAMACLARSWAVWYEIWQSGGFAEIRKSWLARAARLGMGIRARLATEELSGVFEGIDEQGALILRQSDGRLRAIAAGDMFFSA